MLPRRCRKPEAPQAVGASESIYWYVSCSGAQIGCPLELVSNSYDCRLSGPAPAAKRSQRSIVIAPPSAHARSVRPEQNARCEDDIVVPLLHSFKASFKFPLRSESLCGYCNIETPFHKWLLRLARDKSQIFIRVNDRKSYADSGVPEPNDEGV